MGAGNRTIDTSCPSGRRDSRVAAATTNLAFAFPESALLLLAVG
jgi:hypothetical protein